MHPLPRGGTGVGVVRGKHDVVDDPQMREEVEMLKDHSHFLPDEVDIGLRVVQGVFIDDDAAGGDRFQTVHAT